MKKLYFLFFKAFSTVLSTAIGNGLHGQSANCIDSDPFCTGINYVFPASVGAGSAEDGPDYGCLVTQPNPVWYHMQIDDPGDLFLEMNLVKKYWRYILIP